MGFGIGRLLRRARRLGITSSISWTGPTVPRKHIKIDDEERQSGDASGSFHSRIGSPNRMKMLLLLLLLLILLVLIIIYIIYKPPPFVINFLQWKYPNVLFHVHLPSTQKIVALTLDDAPSTETAKILDILKTYGAKATFFIIGGQVAAHPDILQRIHDEGHEVGNHAWADEPSINLPLPELKRQIQEVEALLPPNKDSAKYFRPGSGLFNKKMVDLAMALDYRVVLGSIFPFDPQIHSATINSRHVLSMVRPGGIIIMHDRRSYSAQQVEFVLKGLAAKEWKVGSLGGLLGTAPASNGRRTG